VVSEVRQPPALRVNRDRCIGAGLCVLTAPEVFDQADDGLVVLLSPSPPDESDEDVREAVRRCPSGALTLQE
jgi:ferredoxin